MKTEKPNILMIMSDQLTAEALGCYGSEVGVTPRIDELADRGTRFDRFYCNSPMCCPSRASMFSGQLPSNNGVYDNGSPFPSDTPTFLHGLKSSGYRTTLSGKAHFIGPDQYHGFDRRVTREIYPSSFIWTPNWLEPVALNGGSNIGQVRESGECILSLQLEYDREVLHHGLVALRREAKRIEDGTSNAPFFLNVSFTHPHDPFVIPEAYLERVNPALVGPPRSEWGTAASHRYNAWINTHHGHDEISLTEEEVMRARRGYYGSCAFIDDCVGSLLDEVASLGLSENTLILFMSDHGEMLGEHGMWFKRTFYEEAARVPFIASWPGTVTAASTVENTASLVDLFPTFCEIGCAHKDFVSGCTLDGRSFAGALLGGKNSHDGGSCAVIEYLGEGTVEPLRAVVSKRGKLVEVLHQPDILFDLENDPHETVDLTNAEGVESGERALDLERSLRPVLETGWNASAVKAAVIESQSRRRIINAAVYGENPPSWDCIPDDGVGGAYVKRNGQRESKDARFPRYGNEE